MSTVLKSALDALHNSIYDESFITKAGLTDSQIAFVYQNGTFLDEQWVAEEPFNFESNDPQLVLKALSKPYYGNPVLQGVRQTLGLVDRLENKFSANEFMNKLNSVRDKLNVVEITRNNVAEYLYGEIDADVVVVTYPALVTSIRARVLICNADIVADRIFVSHYALMVAPKIDVRDLNVPCRGYLITANLNIRDSVTTRAVSVSMIDQDPIRIWASHQSGVTVRVPTEPWYTLDSKIVDEFHQCPDYVCEDGTFLSLSELNLSDTSWLTQFWFSDPQPEPARQQAQAQPKPKSEPKQEAKAPEASAKEAPEAAKATKAEAKAPEASTVPAGAAAVAAWVKATQARLDRQAKRAKAKAEAAKASAAEDPQKSEPAEAESDDDACVKIQPKPANQDDELYTALRGTTNHILKELFAALGIPLDKSMGKGRKITHLLELCRKDPTDVTRSNVLAALAGIKAQEEKKSQPDQEK